MRPKATDAHRLLGQINEGLGNKEKAVQSYKTSYELGGGQKDLILKSKLVMCLYIYMYTFIYNIIYK